MALRGVRGGGPGALPHCSELWAPSGQGLLRAACHLSCPPSPAAAVSPVLDCGYCLVGGIKATRFLCKNVGFSAGKFCVMPQASWPPPCFRVSDGACDLGTCGSVRGDDRL